MKWGSLLNTAEEIAAAVGQEIDRLEGFRAAGMESLKDEIHLLCAVTGAAFLLQALASQLVQLEEVNERLENHDN